MKMLKTTSGTREIPVSDEVYACFQRIIANRKKVKKEPIINGKCGFLYLDKDGIPNGSPALGEILSAHLREV